MTLLDESIHETTLGAIATMASLAAALVGIAILARSQSGPPASKPLSGTATGAGRDGAAALAAAPS